MIKKSTYSLIIIFIFFFTACVERGSVTPTIQKTIIRVDTNQTITKDSSVPTLILHKKENNFNSLANNLSGSIIFVIGMILLF